MNIRRYLVLLLMCNSLQGEQKQIDIFSSNTLTCSSMQAIAFIWAKAKIILFLNIFKAQRILVSYVSLVKNIKNNYEYQALLCFALNVQLIAGRARTKVIPIFNILLFLNIFVAIRDGVFLFPKKNLQRSVL